MKSLLWGAVFGAIVLCATVAVTASFGGAREGQEGRQTIAQHDPVKTPEEQAQYDAAQRAQYEALQQEVRELAAQKEREADRQAYRDAAALQALGLALSSGGPMRTSPAPVFQPIPLPGNNFNQTQRLRSSCLSQAYGNQILTNCQ